MLDDRFAVKAILAVLCIVLGFGLIAKISAEDKSQNLNRCEQIKERLIQNAVWYNKNTEAGNPDQARATVELVKKIQSIDCSNGFVPKPVKVCDP